jgi:hypothetical protein
MAVTFSDPHNCGGCGITCKPGAQCAGGACINKTDKQFVVAGISLPAEPPLPPIHAWDTDIDGDGTLDNQLIVLCDTIYHATLGMVDLQKSIDSLLYGGELDLMLNVPADDAPDAGTPTDPTAYVSLLQLKATNKVDTFSTQSSYAADNTLPATLFKGGAMVDANGKPSTSSYLWTANDKQPPPVFGLKIRSTLGAQVTFTIPFRVHRLFLVFHDGANGDALCSKDQATWVAGNMQGSILKKDLENGFAVDVAGYMDAEMNSPSQVIQKMYGNLFSVLDHGDGSNWQGNKCLNPDGTYGYAFDGHISPCELITSQLLQGVFTPDVQVWVPPGAAPPYSTTGKFSPTPHSMDKDSLSFGLAFNTDKAALQ